MPVNFANKKVPIINRDFEKPKTNKPYQMNSNYICTKNVKLNLNKS